MAAKTVTIQSLPKKTRAATSAISTIAVRIRFMCLVEDTWSRGGRVRVGTGEDTLFAARCGGGGLQSVCLRGTAQPERRLGGFV